MDSSASENVQHATSRRQKISSDLRERIIHYLHSNTKATISETAKTFGVAVSTTNGILRRYEARGTVQTLPKGGARNIKINMSAQNIIGAWIDEKPDITLREIRARLSTEYSIAVTVGAISTAISKHGFTVKILRTIPIARNCPENIQARFEYAQLFLNDAPADRRSILWIDECGFNLHIRRKCGRSRRGERASIVVANGRGRNISACAAMSEEGFIHERLRPGAYNAEEFCIFLRELFVILGQMGKSECWLILDNVRFHHSQIVASCAAQFGHHLVFLPAYSPMLNPIESLFGKWKTLIRSMGQSMTQDSLLESMAISRSEISVADCLGWIRDINRNIGMSLQRHVFE